MVPPDSDSASESKEPSLSVDAILDILAHHHRRKLLRILRDTAGNTVPEDELIRRLQEQEQQRTGVQPSWDHVSATLHHIHEPKLSEAGIVTYDEIDEKYRYQSHEQVEEMLDLIESVHDSDA